jgi:hypothetical protein
MLMIMAIMTGLMTPIVILPVMLFKLAEFGDRGRD